MALLEIKDLHVEFPLAKNLVDSVLFKNKKSLKAVNGVSFSLEEGETLGLVGESGCGKSTLGKAIMGLVEPTSGEFLFKEQNISPKNKEIWKDFRNKAQMVFQDPYGSLNPQFTIGSCLTEVLKVHNLCKPAEMETRVIELLTQVGLAPDVIRRKPAALSGGQCQRVGIARALAVSPKLLIADESVSALDVSIQAQILNLFMELQIQHRLTMLFISHDLGVVKHICQKIAVMYLGSIVEMGTTEEIFHHPKHPYTQALIGAIPKMNVPLVEGDLLGGEPPSPINAPQGCPFHPRCTQALQQCRHSPKPALVNINGTQTACHLYSA